MLECHTEGCVGRRVGAGIGLEAVAYVTGKVWHPDAVEWQAKVMGLARRTDCAMRQTTVAQRQRTLSAVTGRLDLCVKRRSGVGAERSTVARGRILGLADALQTADERRTAWAVAALHPTQVEGAQWQTAWSV